MIRAFAFCAALLPLPAWACAVCGCGDPTITALGTEKPYRNRLRASLELRYRSDSVGIAKIDQIQLHEERIDAQLAWAPHPRVFLLASVPGLRREIGYTNLRRVESYGLGDIELRVKVFVAHDRPLRPRHLLAVIGGVKFPAAPIQRGRDGVALPLELQAGTGSFDPLAGISYAYFFSPGLLFLSANGTYPTQGRYDFRASPSLRLTATAQYNVLSWFAPRVGIDARIDGKGRENGGPARDSGGVVGFLSFELLFTPVQDMLVFAAVRIPVVQALQGYHREGSFANVGIAYDFGP